MDTSHKIQKVNISNIPKWKNDFKFTTTDQSNFDKQWSDAYFVFFLFYYNCIFLRLSYVHKKVASKIKDSLIALSEDLLISEWLFGFLNFQKKKKTQKFDEFLRWILNGWFKKIKALLLDIK